MNIKFNIFIFLGSGALACVIVYFFVPAYLSYVGPGNTFGGELVFMIPIIFTISFLSFYLLLGELFIKKQTIPSGYIQQADTSQNKLTNRAVFALVELIVASLLCFVFFWVGLAAILYLAYFKIFQLLI